MNAPAYTFTWRCADSTNCHAAKPRFDLDTYYGRYRHFMNVTDPRCVLARALPLVHSRAVDPKAHALASEVSPPASQATIPRVLALKPGIVRATVLADLWNACAGYCW